ncbi:hypothetical protein F4824DRAFT_513313 [Ustulina deusta]|nr:hypothetical protein F4824DRAFT_513313 [Ustulina deusta]
MATTTKKPIMSSMTSRLRLQPGLFFRRIFNLQHRTRDTKLDSTECLPIIDEKQTLPRVSEKSTPLSQLADSSIVSRPMGTLENFFQRLAEAGASANREHAAFFTVLQVRFPSQVVKPEDHIARAWEVVGRRFPALRSEISPPEDGDSQKRSRITIRPFDKHDFQSTFSVHPDCPNVDVLFAAPSPVESTAKCYWLPGPGQIVLRTSHWRTDGFGQVLLTDAFMSTLADIIQRGVDAPLDEDDSSLTQQAPITPALEDLIRKYVKEPPSEAAEADILMDTYANGGKSIAIPTRPGSDGAVASTCSRAAIRMSAESSSELSHACRAQGVSVTSALNAAIIRATARYPQDAEADSYVIFAPVDLRAPLIAAGAQECARPEGVYVSGLPLRIAGVVKHLETTGESVPGKSFGGLADELSAFYSQDLLRYKRPGDDDAAKTVSLLQVAEPYLERMTELFAGFPAPGCPFPKTPVISSLGKMDGLIKREYPCDDGDSDAKVRVTDFWVGIENATPMITFHPWSWGDELTLSAAWNETFYSREIAVDALEKIMEELGEGLKMEPVSYRVVTACCDSST